MFAWRWRRDEFDRLMAYFRKTLPREEARMLWRRAPRWADEAGSGDKLGLIGVVPFVRRLARELRDDPAGYDKVIDEIGSEGLGGLKLDYFDRNERVTLAFYCLSACYHDDDPRKRAEDYQRLFSDVSAFLPQAGE